MMQPLLTCCSLRFLGRMPLHLALGTGDVNITRLLIEHGAEVNSAEEYGNTPLLIACDRANLELVRLLIEHGAHPNLCGVFNRTPLSAAAVTGCVDLVQYLIDESAAVDWPDTDGNTAMHHACFRGHDGVFLLLSSALIIAYSFFWSVFSCSMICRSWDFAVARRCRSVEGKCRWSDLVRVDDANA